MKTDWLVHTDEGDKTLDIEELCRNLEEGKASILSWVMPPNGYISYFVRLYCVKEVIHKMQWVYCKNGATYGPVSGKELEKLYISNKIDGTTPVKMCGQDLWHRYYLIAKADRHSKVVEHINLEEEPREELQSIAVSCRWPSLLSAMSFLVLVFKRWVCN